MSNPMDNEITKIYGNRLRVRVCGLCWEGESILLVNHKMTSDKNLWIPPGGGVEFGETLEKALKREFLEETGLEVAPSQFAFGCEFIKDPLHSIELFFHVIRTGGALKTGYDPELQLIQDVRFLSEKEINAISIDELHAMFKLADRPTEVRKLSGFYSI